MVDLLSAVLADPFDDGLRCVLSDQVAESNVTIPALDLPQGVEVVWRDGLPDEIRCTMIQWVGITCSKCNGDGFRRREDQHNRRDCQVCNGSGRTPGIAKPVCEQWPVTRVVLTDCQPIRCVRPRSLYGWLCQVNDRHNECVIEKDIWNLLSLWNYYGGPPTLLKWYTTETEALAALSYAAIAYGRRLAGLPDLPFVWSKENKLITSMTFPIQLTDEQIEQVENYFLQQ